MHIYFIKETLKKTHLRFHKVQKSVHTHLTVIKMGAKVVLFGNTQQESKLMHIYFGIRFYGIYLTWMTNQAPLCANYYRT